MTPIQTAVMQANLRLISPLLKRGSIENCRALQDRLGELMTLRHMFDSERSDVIDMGAFTMVWESPRHPPRRGAVLYLHGGGYTAGDLPYSLGFASTLAAETSRRVLCAAYRLAPENPFPAALDDAVAAYRYLLEQGYGGEDIALCGESAGGGLVLCLCLKLRELGLPLPACLICISPWTDLTLSGESIEFNKKAEPSLSREMLLCYVEAYTGGDEDAVTNPLVSPIFGDLSFLPPCLIFAGGGELILSDSTMLYEKLVKEGVDVTLRVAEKLWHAYVLYGIPEARQALGEISEFIEEHIS